MISRSALLSASKWCLSFSLLVSPLAHARQIYLSEAAVTGDAALSVCGPGFSLASISEIHPGLDYDSSRGIQTDDSGQGPPNGVPGWARTGLEASNQDNPGIGNCNVWSSTSGHGTALQLIEGRQALESFPCSMELPAWCIGQGLPEDGDAILILSPPEEPRAGGPPVAMEALLLDGNNEPLQGVLISFDIGSVGQVEPIVAPTDANGIATTYFSAAENYSGYSIYVNAKAPGDVRDSLFFEVLEPGRKVNIFWPILGALAVLAVALVRR